MMTTIGIVPTGATARVVIESKEARPQSVSAHFMPRFLGGAIAGLGKGAPPNLMSNPNADQRKPLSWFSCCKSTGWETLVWPDAS
jgi:hypothetical protein